MAMLFNNRIEKTKKFIYSCSLINILCCFSFVSIYCLFFLPHAFIVVEGINLISAFEVDPGSIIVAITSLFEEPIYNMLATYHTQYYGWTYVFLNFIFLLPIKLILWLSGQSEASNVFLSIRIILFFIGLVSSILFYSIVLRIFKKPFIAYILVLLYISTPSISYFFYFVHPETTGLLFLFLGIHYLLNFTESEKPFHFKHYMAGLTFLVLSALSKQIFFFATLPVLFLFFVFSILKSELSLFDILKNKKFFYICIFSFIYPIVLLFIIHPYSIIQISDFFTHQILLFSFHSTGVYTVSIVESIRRWVVLISEDRFLLFSYITIILSLIVSITLNFRLNIRNRLFWYANSVSVLLLTFFIFLTHRMFIHTKYLLIIYPFVLISISAIANLFLNRNKRIFTWISYMIYAFLIYSVFINLNITSPFLMDRLNYRNQIAFKTHEFINQNIQTPAKIAHDHTVAIPNNDGYTACHYWHGCGTDYINEFNPDYICLYEDWLVVRKQSSETKKLLDYVKNNRFSKIAVINSTQKSVNGKQISVTCYSKMNSKREIIYW